MGNTASTISIPSDYLYMLQACIATGGFLAIFLVFRYQIIDRYVDNRKEAIRELCNVNSYPERAKWIQDIGKSKDSDKELIKLQIPSIHYFIDEIYSYREWRDSLIWWGGCTLALWVILMVLYLIAQTFNWYGSCLYHALMLIFILPTVFNFFFYRKSINPPKSPNNVVEIE